MDPFQHMHDWKNNLDHFFGGNFWDDFEHMIKPPIPAINMYELDSELIIYVNLPGIKDRKQVNVFVDHNVLELKGSMFPVEQSGKLIKQEILQGDFSRQIDLPFAVREDRVTAHLKQGLMTIHLYRLVNDRKKKREIDIEEFED
ncbi:Hsp20/alpha crystallin family protein [Gracilibacillus caseinilyticus]|uniref:Hsp20/alpha crystallin family protein n=1 Tax=Gracilibacillus caseinilyticus TaxID=2932256 RepID=A0ABY4F3J0_9BACI|nr:Hsp20/alpha crystallin family protein [Gracilibacillus caseinilyticus]UOQ49016.1 Hsp20/alpha crystallin family protein [Gracilibacillus caseinilyticus]